MGENLAASQNTKHRYRVTYEPEIQLQTVDPGELKIYVYKKSFTWKYLAYYSKYNPKWKQPNVHQATDGWTKFINTTQRNIIQP